MALTVSGVFVFGLATWICWRTFGLRVSHAICAGLLGFFLAETGLAPAIRHGVSAVFAWIASWHL
ncbi:MAG: DUF2304 domain-containing protein [Actinomycetales bacterium]|nr:DUF2304 domain-containing protein [Actinomycetales bacterium]